MGKTTFRVVISLVIVGVVAMGAASLLAKPGGGKGGFKPCPVPSCMQPCIYPPQPEVLCMSPDGSISETSFACCCCGGSAGWSYKPIKKKK